MEPALEADCHLYEAGLLELDAAVELSQGGMPVATPNAIQAPQGGKKGASRLQPLIKQMVAMSGKMKAVMKLPTCQQVHAEKKQRNGVACETRNALQHLYDSKSTGSGSLSSLSSGDMPSRSCSRDVVQQLACPSCNAMGAFTIFDTPCGVDDVHFKQTCHMCHGSCMVSAEGIKCMKCKGLGCLGSWRKHDTQFKCACTACEGKGYLAAVVRSSQDGGSKRGRNDCGWSLVKELKQLSLASEMEEAARAFAYSKKDCSMAALAEAVDCSPFPSTQMAIIKAVAPNVFGEQCVVIEASVSAWTN